MSENRQIHNHEDKSGSEMLSEIMRLLLKLLLMLITKVLRFIIKVVRFLFRLLKMLLQACADYWNDNSTQEKIRMGRRWCRNAMHTALRWSVIAFHTLCRWSVIALKATWRGMVWTAKAIVRGIIHLRPTIILTGRMIAKGLKATWRGMVWSARMLKTYALRRKRAYQAFRQNKGFKGLLLDIKNHLQRRINDYMDEGQEDKESDAMSYSEYITDEIGDDNKTRSIGKKIYTGMNKLFDDND